MKSLKHFAYAFLHLFTFVIMLYFYNAMPEFLARIDHGGLWFICLIILINALMGIMHLGWFIQALNGITKQELTYEDYLP